MSFVMSYRFEKLRKTIRKESTFFSSGFLSAMMVEVIILLIHPSPFLVGVEIKYRSEINNMDLIYSVNDFLNLLVLLRIIVIVKVILMNSYWFSNRAKRVW